MSVNMRCPLISRSPLFRGSPYFAVFETWFFHPKIREIGGMTVLAFLRARINFTQLKFCTVEFITAEILHRWKYARLKFMHTLAQNVHFLTVRILTDKVAAL